MNLFSRRAAALLGALGFLAAAAGDVQAEGRAKFSPNGDRVAIALAPSRLKIVKADGTAAAEIALDSAFTELAFSPDSRMLGVCLETGGVAVVDLATMAKTTTADAAGRCSDLAWSAKSDKLAYALTNTDPGAPGADVEVKIWEAAAGRARSVHAHKTPRVAFTPPPDPGPFPASGPGAGGGRGDGTGGGQGKGRRNAAPEAAPAPDPTVLINEQRAKFAAAEAAEEAKRRQEQQRQRGPWPGPAVR